jgi:hypothetical protein
LVSQVLKIKDNIFSIIRSNIANTLYKQPRPWDHKLKNKSFLLIFITKTKSFLLIFITKNKSFLLIFITKK